MSWEEFLANLSRMAAGYERRIERALTALAERFAPRLRELMSQQAPRRTGAFAEAQQAMAEGTSILGMAPVPLALWIAHGTAPHEIRAVNARALRWEDDAGVHFAVRVWHPGTAPNPYYMTAAELLLQEITAQAGDVAGEVMDELA